VLRAPLAALEPEDGRFANADTTLETANVSTSSASCANAEDWSPAPRERLGTGSEADDAAIQDEKATDCAQRLRGLRACPAPSARPDLPNSRRCDARSRRSTVTCHVAVRRSESNNVTGQSLAQSFRVGMRNAMAKPAARRHRRLPITGDEGERSSPSSAGQLIGRGCKMLSRAAQGIRDAGQVEPCTWI